LKTFQIALIGWIKAGPPKSYFSFDHVNRLNIKLSKNEYGMFFKQPYKRDFWLKTGFWTAWLEGFDSLGRA